MTYTVKAHSAQRVQNVVNRTVVEDEVAAKATAVHFTGSTNTGHAVVLDESGRTVYRISAAERSTMTTGERWACANVARGAAVEAGKDSAAAPPSIALPEFR